MSTRKYRRQHQEWDIQIHIRTHTHTTTGHTCIAIHAQGSLGTNTNTNRDRDKGSRRLTHLADFDMSVEPVLDPAPGSLEPEGQVVDIGMIVEVLVFVVLIIS